MSDAADFDAVAGLYATARPSYPREAVDWLVPAPGLDVVDVGAGTGLFTRLLLDHAGTLTAIEPSGRMLDELRRGLHHVPALQGSGERMPLPDASADIVVFAQAWHWVDPVAASAEVARVLRPGGTLGLVWNLRDERVGWVRALGEAMRADGDHFRGDVEDPRVAAPFAGAERSFVAWMRLCTADEIVADVQSRSYFSLLSLEEQRDTIAEVRGVLQRHRGSSEDDVFELPYVTAAYRYTRP